MLIFMLYLLATPRVTGMTQEVCGKSLSYISKRLVCGNGHAVQLHGTEAENATAQGSKSKTR